MKQSVKPSRTMFQHWLVGITFSRRRRSTEDIFIFWQLSATHIQTLCVRTTEKCLPKAKDLCNSWTHQLRQADLCDQFFCLICLLFWKSYSRLGHVSKKRIFGNYWRSMFSQLHFFGSVARSDSRQDINRAISVSLRPPRDWRRPWGCLQTTWLMGTVADVQLANIGIHSAWRKANDTATLHYSHTTAEEKNVFTGLIYFMLPINKDHNSPRT